jgi:tRNA-splicing ligase RtcB
MVSGLFRDIPCGVGSTGQIKVLGKEACKVMTRGAAWAVQNGYGTPDDLVHTEDRGCMAGADPSLISKRAFKRGARQLGTLGAGNHFIELQVVDRVFNRAAAAAFGLTENQVTVMIHTGSRGFGYQVCDDFLASMTRAASRYGIHLPDRQLCCAPFSSVEGQNYFAAMKCAANYAWANRQCLTHWARESLMHTLRCGPRDLGGCLIYDVAHNIAKVETHQVAGHNLEVCVHRKGATRAFPAGHPALPEDYRAVGQPVLIPGDMGTNSYIMVGKKGAMQKTFGSTCHGAGRVMSRKKAIREGQHRSIAGELERKGIFVMARGRKTLFEEMPDAYKDISSVVDVVEGAGLSEKVVRLRPIGVVKG